MKNGGILCYTELYSHVASYREIREKMDGFYYCAPPFLRKSVGICRYVVGIQDVFPRKICTNGKKPPDWISDTSTNFKIVYESEPIFFLTHL